METTAAFADLACTGCGARHPPETPGRCPDCDAPLEPSYDLDAVDAASLPSDPDDAWAFAPLLPIPADAAVTIGEGGTPLVDAPAVADAVGVDSVLVKDEGRNPTGSVADRGASLAVSVAAAAGADAVALASGGTTAQSVAAYAGRAGLASTAFVPSRAGFVRKAMINVHGGQMSVVEGRLPDAEGAYAAAAADADWHPAGTFDSPYAVEGRKTLAYEVLAALDWTAPDAVILPTGSGADLVATHRALGGLRALGVIEETPALYAAQAEGCAPIARAVADGPPVEPWETPDTIAGDVEDPDPAGGDRAAAACRDTGGGAVAVADPDLLESAVRVTATTGVETSVAGGVAAAALWDLSNRGALDDADTVVVVNPVAGSADADVLRSQLMGQGV